MYVRMNMLAGDPARLGEATRYLEGTVRPEVEARHGNRGLACLTNAGLGVCIVAAGWHTGHRRASPAGSRPAARGGAWLSCARPGVGSEASPGRSAISSPACRQPATGTVCALAWVQRPAAAWAGCGYARGYSWIARPVPVPDCRSLVVMPMRSGLFLPLFDELADPAVVARLSVEAEEAGWHGVFVWDHVRWREPVSAVADPWITLAAVATATGRVRLGPMVTPLARRRPVKVARETATLDRLSGGRLTLGVGLGSDQFGNEFSVTGEELDERRRARMLDESLDILTAAWSGEPVRHRGEYYTVDGMRFLPRPVQRPGVPVWVAGFYGKPRPLRRAARYQGFMPVNLEHPGQLSQIVADLSALRQAAGTAAQPYDVAAALPPGSDPVPYAAAGATWWLVEFPAQGATADLVRAVIREGPAARS